MPIRLVLADDSYIVREGIEHVLDAAEHVEVVGSVGDMDLMTGPLS